MPLQITARKVELSQQDRDHIEERADRFRKLAVNDKISTLDVVITEQKSQYSVEVIVKASRFSATGKETGKDLRGAIDNVMGKVERQLRRQLDKKLARRHGRGGARRDVTLTVSPETGGLAEAEAEHQIIRTQRIAIKPMSVEEAAEQLEIETGAFRVFTNAETDRINIIYRREDNHFGLIEPS